MRTWLHEKEHSTPHIGNSHFHFCSPKALLNGLWVNKSGNGFGESRRGVHAYVATCKHATPHLNNSRFHFWSRKALVKKALGEHKWKQPLLKYCTLYAHVATWEHSTPHASNSRFHLCSPKAVFKRLWVNKSGTASANHAVVYLRTWLHVSMLHHILAIAVSTLVHAKLL